jgi:hypothetical protein
VVKIKKMTQDILEHLNDVLLEMKRLSKEIDVSVKDEMLDENISEEIEAKVYEPLLDLIDSFDDIVESINKLDDVDFFNDPYGDELNN